MKTLYYNATVYTGEDFAQAFIVQEDRFLAVGSNAELLSQPYDEKIDMQGAFVCAGFNDSHMHLLNYGQMLSQAKLQEHTASLEDMLGYIREYVQNNNTPGRWISGRGWNQDYFNDCDRMPNKQDLDAISKDIPMIMTRACGHSCVVNSKVLQLANIDEKTPAPEGGAIDYENGILYDNAMELLNTYIPLPDKEALKDMLEKGSRALNTYGITSCQSDDYCVFREIPFETINEAFEELKNEGRLTVRVTQQANFMESDEFQRFVEEGNLSGNGDEMYRIGPLKMLGDGSLGARTAHLSRPYHDDPSTCGFSLFSDDQFNKMIDYANRHNMNVAVHAIGDKCLDKVLNAIENALQNNPREDHRHGIVHCQISRPDQLERMERLKLHIYAQSVFLDYDNHIVEQRVGKELAASSYNWKTLKDKGLSVSNGSDAPVETPDALRGIECAVTRTSLDGTGPYLPDQAFSVKEALDSFTIESAKASFEENYKGKIAPDYLADFTILKQDPFKIDERKIHEIEVLATYLGGKCVYKK